MSGSLILGGLTGRAMESAPAGVIETGSPAFVVLGPEALGLSSAPTDIKLLPDGRILVVSQRELAFGDGVRWDTFHAPGNETMVFSSVAVDTDGEIYLAMGDGVARVELNKGRLWGLAPVIALGSDTDPRDSALVSVADFPDNWYWYGGNGAVVSWRPGREPRHAGPVGTIDRVFTLGEDVYFTDESVGRLFHWRSDGAVEQSTAVETLVSESVTCAIPFEPGELLVGTVSAGLKLFDGETFRPFGPPGLLNSGKRITDLCPAGEGFLAASIDTVGIVFFDRTGRTVQVLERSLDHRLARVKHLLYAGNGALWALMNEGVARVEFPSPISHFEPLLASGLVYVHPLRHAGGLWILTDGRVMRGVYDEHGLLERFADDTPPGRYLFTVASVDGHLFGCNEDGIFVREEAGWRLVLPGIVNARVGLLTSGKHGIFYSAVGEYGTIQHTNGRFIARRIPMPGLTENYNPVEEASGTGWFELGMNRVGRLEARDGVPELRTFGTKDGLTDGWIEIYLVDGIARFHVGNKLYRFDDRSEKFLEDVELLSRIPQLAVAGGRPVTDGAERLWYTANGRNQILDRSATGGNRPIKVRHAGFSPVNYTLQDDGVVWMFERRRFVRMDLRVPEPSESPLRALITSVQFPDTNREIFAPASELEAVDYDDNSLVFHFAAPANPFATPVTFEVMLEGAGKEWVSTGAVGSATFNHLKEGSYAFRVRPVRAGAEPGTEARLGFIVQPPWFRTTPAKVIYGVAALGALALVIWLPVFLQHREKERLELLVAQRTAELHTTNEQLGRQINETVEKSDALSASEERYRVLNADLERRVAERTAKLAEASGLLEAMLDNSPDFIYFKDRESRFVRFSRAFAARFHLSDHEIIRGKTDFDFFDISHAQPAFDDEQEIMRTGQPIIGKLEQENYANGTVTWVLTTKMPWCDGAGAIIGTFGISKDVTAWKETESKLAATHELLLKTSRQAGMAEVATGVLHNVGNVLNSVNVSATLMRQTLNTSEVTSLERVASLLRDRSGDIGDFFNTDPKARMIPGIVIQLADQIGREHATLLAEQAHLLRNVEHIKSIVAMQQNYATVSGIREKVRLADLLGDVLQMHAVSFVRHGIEVAREYENLPEMILDKHKVMQILVNLVANARQAIDETGRRSGWIHVRLQIAGGERVRVSISDDGVGIPPENFTRIFSHGFTTRQDGHGFGLHSGALAAREMGGSLTVDSAGAGLGATFTLELPIETAGPKG